MYLQWRYFGNWGKKQASEYPPQQECPVTVGWSIYTLTTLAGLMLKYLRVLIRQIGLCRILIMTVHSFTEVVRCASKKLETYLHVFLPSDPGLTTHSFGRARASFNACMHRNIFSSNNAFKPDLFLLTDGGHMESFRLQAENSGGYRNTTGFEN